MVCVFTLFGTLNIITNSMLIYGLFKINKKNCMNFGQKLFVYLSCIDLAIGLFTPVLSTSWINMYVYGCDDGSIWLPCFV